MKLTQILLHFLSLLERFFFSWFLYSILVLKKVRLICDKFKYHHVIQQEKLQIESQGLKHKIVLGFIYKNTKIWGRYGITHPCLFFFSLNQESPNYNLWAGFGPEGF